MGMFDSVYAACPKCGEAIEFQSKDGDCVLAGYNVDSVPIEIAISLDGEVASCRCGEVVKLKIAEPLPPRRIAMELEE